MIASLFGPPGADRNHEPIETSPWQEGWLDANGFAAYLVSQCSDVSPLKGTNALVRLKDLQEQGHTLSSPQLLSVLSAELAVHPLEINVYHNRDLGRIIPLVFAQKNDQFLPNIKFPEIINPSEVPEEVKLFFLCNVLPTRKLTKLQFVQEVLKNRFGQLGLLLSLGTAPILLAAGAELLNQPLFDGIVPSGRVPLVLLIGIATLFCQGAGQVITSITQQYQVIFNGQVDLASKLSTGERFLKAKTQDLPERDVGSWRLTFSVASAFMGSLESMVISIPLALFSLVVNLLVMGAYTDQSAISHLLLICMIPALVSLAITYAGSMIAIKLMGQQSQLESIIYSVVKNIRGIWMTSSAPYFQRRFSNARAMMGKNLIKSGTIGASTQVIDKITTGLLYTYIYTEYYRSTTTPGSHQLSVGSLLVIYSAIGIITGSLNSLTGDMVSIFQTLPTYWTPNAIRDISSFVAPADSQQSTKINSIIFDNVSYLAKGINGPFKTPFSLELNAPGSVAIMGPSGSGKSTLLRLLLGHLKPSSGNIQLIDGFGNEAGIELYQADVLVISQELRLFGDHLRDVMDPGGNYTDDDLEKAAEAMGLTTVLNDLPLRWLTPINEFSRDLSLGQLQLFKLSKALLRHHSIIISDEPTCHLPENLHIEALQKLNFSCDLHISVLHRQSAMNLFDQILELNKNGEIKMSRRES